MHIMNAIHYIARLAQALLAGVTVADATAMYG
jgi:hypothetical protein